MSFAKNGIAFVIGLVWAIAVGVGVAWAEMSANYTFSGFLLNFLPIVTLLIGMVASIVYFVARNAFGAPAGLGGMLLGALMGLVAWAAVHLFWYGSTTPDIFWSVSDFLGQKQREFENSSLSDFGRLGSWGYALEAWFAAGYAIGGAAPYFFLNADKSGAEAEDAQA